MCIRDRLGTTRALIVHSDDGLDELSISAPSTIFQVRGGEITSWKVTPEEVGLRTVDIAEVTARDLDHAAVMMQTVLDGTDQGPARDMTLLNAAAALLACDLVDDLKSGVEMAAASIDDGKATQALADLARVSNAG